MNGFVHVDGAKVEKKGRTTAGFRMIKSKLALFSSDTLSYILIFLFTASIMFVNSYFKASNLAQKVEIVKMLEVKKDLEWRRGESERIYEKMVSSSELMKKAKELKLSVATSDKFIEMN